MMRRLPSPCLIAAALVVVLLPSIAVAQQAPIRLFNGTDLSGWSHFLVDSAVPASAVWSVKDGVLTCKGEPIGYLYTSAEYTSFKLVVEWRWAPGAAARLGKTPNSGVFLRLNGDPKPKGVPRTYEVQLQVGNAGDLMGHWGMPLTGDSARRREAKASEVVGDMVAFRKTESAEKPEGEWNICEITVDGPSLVVVMNGKKVNEVTGAAVMAGHVGLQSEGGEIQVRRVELWPVASGTQPDGYFRANGTRIVDGAGHDVLLRGMGLGGWMLQEGYMLGLKKEGTQHSIRARIQDLVGKEDTEEFYRLWRQNHMTRADVDRLGASGFNSIRLPMHYNLFTLPIEDEPVKGKDTWLPAGFEMVDNLVAWCRANRIYLILDLHAAPGGQGKDANISDYDPAKPSLWESDENRRKTVALWRKLAERYANEPWIGGYDILNEPNWTFEGKDKNGREDVGNQPIWDLYKAITKTIREVDARHLIIVEGNGWGNNYRGFPEPWDGNLAMSFHKYWNPNTEEAISGFLALRDTYRLPIWLGESGENTNEWFRECVTLVEKHGIGWAWWPYKKVGNPRCIQTVTAPDDFAKVVAYWNGEGERPSREVARRGLFALVENLKIDKCRYNAEVSEALIPGGRTSGAPAK